MNDWGMDAEGPVQFLLDVPPGTYYVAMAQGEMAGVDDPFEVQLKLEGSLAPDGCTGPIAFSGAESRAYVVGRRDGEGCFACPSLGANVRFEVDGRADYYAPSGEPGAVALSSVELCAAGCGAGASQCAAQPVSGVSGALGTFPAGSTLDLRGTVRPESRLRGFGVRIRGTGG